MGLKIIIEQESEGPEDCVECPKCGAECEAEDKFCCECGAKMPAPAKAMAGARMNALSKAMNAEVDD